MNSNILKIPRFAKVLRHGRGCTRPLAQRVQASHIRDVAVADDRVRKLWTVA